MEVVAKELRDYIVQCVREGFDPPDEIPQRVLDYYELDADDEALAARVEKLVASALQRHYTAQKSWPEVTDCDRLDRAFWLLEKDGIVARQNFTCCQTCGHYEIEDEVAGAAKRRKVRGYTFFHTQDTERAAAGEGLFLAYGSTAGSEAATIDVARHIVAAIERAGLKADWDGSTATRIFVKLKWKKRRIVPAMKRKARRRRTV